MVKKVSMAQSISRMAARLRRHRVRGAFRNSKLAAAR